MKLQVYFFFIITNESFGKDWEYPDKLYSSLLLLYILFFNLFLILCREKVYGPSLLDSLSLKSLKNKIPFLSKYPFNFFDIFYISPICSTWSNLCQEHNQFFFLNFRIQNAIYGKVDTIIIIRRKFCCLFNCIFR